MRDTCETCGATLTVRRNLNGVDAGMCPDGECMGTGLLIDIPKGVTVQDFITGLLAAGELVDECVVVTLANVAEATIENDIEPGWERPTPPTWERDVTPERDGLQEV